MSEAEIADLISLLDFLWRHNGRDIDRRSMEAIKQLRDERDTERSEARHWRNACVRERNGIGAEK